MFKFYSKFQNNSKQKGFTLIELLVVIAIIGLISTVAVIAFTNVRRKSRNSTRVGNMKQIAAAMELVFAENDAYDIGLSSSCVTGDLLSACTDLESFYANIADLHDPLWRVTDINMECDNTVDFLTERYCDYTMAYLGADDYVIYFYLESGLTGDLQGPGIHEISNAGFDYVCDDVVDSCGAIAY